jgi:hypothetical protein
MKKTKTLFKAALLLAGLLALATPTLAAAMSGHDHVQVAQAYPREEVIEKRLEDLEKSQAEIYHTLAEKKTAGLAEKITEKISISGLIEVEAGAEEVEYADGTTDAGSDLVLATAQLGLGMKATEHISGDLIFLFEEDATDLEIDEAAINLSNDVLFGRFGRQYVPFGVFNSHFISDPLTLELGETRETALLAGYNRDLFSLSAFIFNGDAEKAGQEDHIRDWGLSLTVTPMENVELGASYLSDLADTDAELLEEYTERVGGWSAYAVLGFGDFEFSGEFLGATESFDAADLDEDGNGSGDKPAAWNLELSYAVAENIEVALRYEGSDEFAGQPERQYGVAASWAPWEHVNLALEYLRGEFDNDFAGDLASDGGSPADKRDLVTAQLAFEF